MRNVSKVTPTRKRAKDEESAARKLVQARLPFKIIAPGKTPAVEDATAKSLAGSSPRLSTSVGVGVGAAAGAGSGSTQKRKLSDEESSRRDTPRRRPASKENLALTGKKKKTEADAAAAAAADAVVVILSDDDREDAVDEARAAPEQEKPQKLAVLRSAASPKTPIPARGRRKGAGTPQSSGKAAGSSSATKIQIKLPMGGSNQKNKRRKSARQSCAGKEDQAAELLAGESSDDIETIAGELNPQKRLRVEAAPAVGAGERQAEQKPSVAAAAETDATTVAEAVEPDESDKMDKDTTAAGQQVAKKCEGKERDAKSDGDGDGDGDVEDDDDVASDTDASEKSKCNSAAEATDEDGEDDGDRTEAPISPKSSGVKVGSASKQSKNLTPKQVKLMEQRRKQREEKERKLQEERLQKQREKDEKELARRREREEKEELRRKEREEKDEQRRKEREEKERKRLAEVEAKNEEKRKRNEAKEEELRKKEDERKRKEQEKEEVAQKKKKVAESFKKWFRPSGADQDQPAKADCPEEVVDSGSRAFRPFQVRGDMTLAPVRRRVLSRESREQLEGLVHNAAEEADDPSLYLAQLKTGKIAPRKWRRPSTNAKEEEEDSDEVLIVEDELERAGEAIVEETHGPVEHLRRKFYKFHENRRPAYCGTWRKKTNLITARRPFVQDKKYFDYEVDSDLEWEEEEPGESLDGSDDEKEKESEDDEYEVDNEWFVPHGHLSDEELQNEDEFGLGEDNDREAQKAKLKLLQQEFAQEMKKKTEKIKPRLIGCIWVDENGNQPDMCPNIIWQTLNTRAAVCTQPPVLDEPAAPEKTESSRSPNGAGGAERTGEKIKPIALSDDLQRDLVRLVHGNSHSKVFLIKEFICFVEATAEAVKNGEVRGPLKSAVREMIDKFAEWQIIELSNSNSSNPNPNPNSNSNPNSNNNDSSSTSSNTNNNNNNNTDKKKKPKKRLCWVVSDEVLERMGLQELSVSGNTWQYRLKPMKTRNAASAKAPKEGDDDAVTPAAEHAAEAEESRKPPAPETANPKQKNLPITKFAKVLTEEELLEKQKALKALPPTKSAAAAAPKKRVPLLMSVARGQQISQPVKNALISQFLKNKAGDTKANSAPAEDVIVLD